MDTAAQLLTVYGSRSEYKDVFQEMLATFTVSTLSIVTNQNGKNYPIIDANELRWESLMVNNYVDFGPPFCRHRGLSRCG